MKEVLFESGGNGRFTGCGETGEPDCAAGLLAQRVALLASEARVPCDVAEWTVSLSNFDEKLLQSLQLPLASCGIVTGTYLRGHCFDRVSGMMLVVNMCILQKRRNSWRIRDRAPQNLVTKWGLIGALRAYPPLSADAIGEASK